MRRCPVLADLLFSHYAHAVTLIGPLKDMLAKRKNAWVFVNNHFEGCAPKTIGRIRERLGQAPRSYRIG